VSADPAEVLGPARLSRMVFEGKDLQPVWDAAMARASASAADAGARMDLATMLLLTGQQEAGLALQAEALALNAAYRRPTRARANATLLALVAPGDMMANTPLDFLLEDAAIDLVSLFVRPGEPVPSPPPHDVAFLAVGQSEANAPILEAIGPALADWPRPMINGAPERIAALTRDGVAARLAEVPGLLAPMAARLDRADLARVAAGAPSPMAFPLLVRPIASHAGAGLAKIGAPGDLLGYLQAQPEAHFYATPFVEYAAADGLYRKQRIVFIEGAPFIAHLAVSEHWMVHYLSAGMAEDADRRAEEAAFMASFDSGFAARHKAAFETLVARIGLDYFGIDCAETPGGDLLIFEADTAMIVHAMDPLDPFAYKQEPMRRLIAAFEAMLRSR